MTGRIGCKVVLTSRYIKRMNTTKTFKLTNWCRALNIVVTAALLIWVGFLFYTGQYARGVSWLCPFVFVVVGMPLFDLAVARGYLKVRSQDSWVRIIGVTLFIFAATILVIAVATSFLE